MGLRLKALAAESGWAFIEQGDQIYLLRPPYKQKIDASEKDIKKAVSTYGFKPSEQSFETIQAVIGFLNREYVRLQQEQGNQPPSSEELGEILGMMEPETWEKFLEMAQNRLIPKGDFKAAERIAQDLLKSERVWSHTEIMKSAKSVLEQCQPH